MYAAHIKNVNEQMFACQYIGSISKLFSLMRCNNNKNIYHLYLTNNRRNNHHRHSTPRLDQPFNSNIQRQTIKS